MDLGGAGVAKHLHDLPVVLPRTIESSTTTSRLPAITSGSGLNFRRSPCLRSSWPGWMKVRGDVAVLDEAVVLGQAGGSRQTPGRGVAGVGDRDHQVGLDGASRQRISPIRPRATCSTRSFMRESGRAK